MTRQGLTRTLALWAAVLLMLASCTIYDDYPHRSQHDIVLRVTDESGNILPDSEAPVDEVYAFVDGIYVGKYAKEADGKIRIVLRKGEEVTSSPPRALTARSSPCVSPSWASASATTGCSWSILRTTSSHRHPPSITAAIPPPPMTPRRARRSSRSAT